jgi:hypothetical protein
VGWGGVFDSGGGGGGGGAPAYESNINISVPSCS